MAGEDPDQALGRERIPATPSGKPRVSRSTNPWNVFRDDRSLGIDPTYLFALLGRADLIGCDIPSDAKN